MHTDQGTPVPSTLQQALDANVELKEALRSTPTSRRFQAMVLGLATMQQMKGNGKGTPVEPGQSTDELQMAMFQSLH